MKKILFMLCLFINTITFAQEVKEVTLVVSGSAPTEEEATLIALRSAIEQTFGTFVSANTTILDDEIVKDEVVSVSKGNIQKYDKLSVNVLPNGQTSVSVKATVSISKLVEYAKSKGSKAEFAGQTFAMNMKMKELRSKNTLEAYRNMCVECGQLFEQAFDFEVTLGEACFVRDGYREELKDLFKSFTEKYGEGYMVPMTIDVLANNETDKIYHLIENTIKSLMLDEQEINDYKQLGLSLAGTNISRCLGRELPIIRKPEVMLEINRIDIMLFKKFVGAFFGFSLVDNSDSNQMLSWVYNRRYLNLLSSKGYRIMSMLGDKNFFFDCPVGEEEKYCRSFHLYYDDLLDFNKRVNEEIITVGFINRSWDVWAFPIKDQITLDENPSEPSVGENKHKKNKRKKKHVEDDPVLKESKELNENVLTPEKQIIYSFQIPIFIPKDEMESFGGLTVNKKFLNIE